MAGPSFGRRLSDWYEEIRRADPNDLGALVADHFRQLRGYLSESIGPLDPEEVRKHWLRPKGNLCRGELLLLLTVAIVPLLMMAARISASPGVLSPALSGGLMPSIGHDLNQILSLQDIPAGHRDRVLYLLFIPTGAMLIALARLTFGLRVIGFRSILIALGFQASGTVPSLILIAVMLTVLLVVRPTLVRIRLPYYARVSVIMCLSCLVLLTALLLAPWLRSQLMWSVAFFPVIVLGLLAEGIAKTLDKDSGLVAVWRTAMTIGIALFLAAVGQSPLFREIAIRFPELVVTQIVAVILISEYLDLQIFQDWDSRLSGMPIPRLFSNQKKLRVAVVCNRKKAGIVGRVGAASKSGYKRRTIKRIKAALRESGHAVKVIEGDMSMLSKLNDFVPAHPLTSQPGGLVMNISHGIQGAATPTHVPAMLEMAGLAYTGPTPLGQLLAHDKILMGALLERSGVPSPERWVVGSLEDLPSEMDFPVVVKPRQAHRYKLRIARDQAALKSNVRAVIHRDACEVILEPYLPGQEIRAALIGNHPAEVLALVEVGPKGKGLTCPASLDAALDERIRAIATSAFEACACRDYALVTVRLARSGDPFVVDVEQVDVLEKGGAFELAAETAGLSFTALLDRILESARTRYREGALAPPLTLVSDEQDSLGEHGRHIVAR